MARPDEILTTFTTPPWQEIGRSVEDRPLLARSFGPDRGDAVVLFGVIHGDEPLGANLLKRLADELDRGVGGPLARPVWLVPVLNPDGFVRRQKNNARDVDLNRNFPAASWRREHLTGYDPGEAPASEPETKALIDLIDRVQGTRFIAIHSPFRTVNYDGPARELAVRMGKKNGYGASADIGYPTPGSFGSCYGVDRGLEVITLEIPFMSEEQAWRENRAALYEALDIDLSS